jgi:hypothetical protein
MSARLLSKATQVGVSRSVLALVAALALVGTAGCTEQNACQESHGITVCGDFGQQLYVTNLAGAPVEWPPVAVTDGEIIVSRGSDLVRIDRNGAASVIGSAGGEATVPSVDAAGNLYVLGSNPAGSQTQLRSLDGAAPATARWQQQIAGRPSGAPPTISDDTVFASVESNGVPTVYAVDQTTGDVKWTRDDASAVALLPDNSLRYLSGQQGVTTESQPRFATLVAEGPDGSRKWSWQPAAGDTIVDYAPGPAGETYVVTANSHELVRISKDGQTDWQFMPQCDNCTVAAAPTVTGDVVYFPVWEVRAEPVDPLFAIEAATGKTRWIYDGFKTKKTNLQGGNLLTTGGSGASTTDIWQTHHHPAGRPVVAQDGTLYVSTDGSVTALDQNGQVVGLALYDTSVGEVTLNTGFMAQPSTWINPGVRPTPVLGKDGTLYVWDGATVRAFRVGKTASRTAWVAPFGGPSNNGRVPN